MFSSVVLLKGGSLTFPPNHEISIRVNSKLEIHLIHLFCWNESCVSSRLGLVWFAVGAQVEQTPCFVSVTPSWTPLTTVTTTTDCVKALFMLLSWKKYQKYKSLLSRMALYIFNCFIIILDAIMCSSFLNVALGKSGVYLNDLLYYCVA